MEKLKIFVNRYKEQFSETVQTEEFQQRLKRGTVVLSNTRPAESSILPSPDSWLGKVNDIISEGDDMYILFTPYEERWNVFKHLVVDGFCALPFMIGNETYMNIICFIFSQPNIGR